MIEAKIIKIEKDANIEKFREIGAKVQRGEAKWYCYTIDSGKGYHYYILL